MKAPEIKVSEALREITIEVKVVGFRSWRVRLWVGTRLLQLAAWAIGCGLNIRTDRDERLEESNSLLRSACQIAERKGADTNWETFAARVRAELIKQSEADK